MASPTLILRRMLPKWVKSLFPRPEPEPVRAVQVIRRDISRLTMLEWRSTADLVAIAGKHLNDPELRMMLDVLRCSASPHNCMIDLEKPQFVRVIWQARTEGYLSALNDLELLAVHQKDSQPLEPTYEPPELTEA